MPRREFSKPVKVAIVKRATRNGEVFCETCGVACSGRFDIDHTIPDALQVDKRCALTADDGKLLCAGSPESCHGRKTALEDVPAIAKAKRNEAKHLGIGGKQTALAGPDRAGLNARKDERSAARGAKAPVARQPGYIGSFRIRTVEGGRQ